MNDEGQAHAEAYALEQMRALILDALEADVQGWFEHVGGSNEFMVRHDAANGCRIPIRIRIEVAKETSAGFSL